MELKSDRALAQSWHADYFEFSYLYQRHSLSPAFTLFYRITGMRNMHDDLVQMMDEKMLINNRLEKIGLRRSVQVNCFIEAMRCRLKIK